MMKTSIVILRRRQNGLESQLKDCSAVRSRDSPSTVRDEFTIFSLTAYPATLRLCQNG
jgi:hypothetical protein